MSNQGKILSPEDPKIMQIKTSGQYYVIRVYDNEHALEYFITKNILTNDAKIGILGRSLEDAMRKIENAKKRPVYTQEEFLELVKIEAKRIKKRELVDGKVEKTKFSPKRIESLLSKEYFSVEINGRHFAKLPNGNIEEIEKDTIDVDDLNKRILEGEKKVEEKDVNKKRK